MTAAEMMLLPYIRDPDKGSRIPSKSTGGAAIMARMKTIAATERHGIIKTPKFPTKMRLLVLVIQPLKRAQRFSDGRCRTEAVISHRNTCAEYDSVAGIRARETPPTHVLYLLLRNVNTNSVGIYAHSSVPGPPSFRLIISM